MEEKKIETDTREEIDIIMEQYSPQSNPESPKFDESDAKISLSSVRTKPLSVRPGRLVPSRLTTDKYYDCTNPKRGIAIIFNHIHFKRESPRYGAKKDAEDLEAALKNLGFTVRLYKDQTRDEIKSILAKVSQENHLEYDCFMCVVMSHGDSNGKVFAHDKEYFVQDLWENFVGTNCPSLIGKPKLFFIQACRGKLVDPGVLLIKPKAMKASAKRADNVDANTEDEDEEFVIPILADLLIMFSTSEGYYSFRNPDDGSWFIQALAKELSENTHDELMTILTSVNRRVAYAYQSYTRKFETDAGKQMPNILSMLTKSFYFTQKLTETERTEAISSIPRLHLSWSLQK